MEKEVNRNLMVMHTFPIDFGIWGTSILEKPPDDIIWQTNIMSNICDPWNPTIKKWLFTMSQPGTNMHQLRNIVLTGIRVGQEKSQLKKKCTSCEVANMSHFELLAGTYVQTWNTLVLSGNKECKPPLSLAISALVSQKESTKLLSEIQVFLKQTFIVPHPLFHISIDLGKL